MEVDGLRSQNSGFPRITFGMIVLNGEPFVRYNLRALYPFAHQIIVVEGSAPAAVAIATPGGHSSDATLETLRDFKAHEDPGDKLTIVTAEDEGHPSGFWPGEKHEQSRAYARRVTGDYLWQVDVDEFYRPKDMATAVDMLREDPGITAMSFKMITFWGGFDTITDGWYLRQGAAIYHRLFRWGPGYQYVTHRPPTVHDAQGRDLRTLRWIDGPALARRGIVMYHYSLLFPQQVREKCSYYGAADWAGRGGALRWAQENYLGLCDPYHVHNVYDYPSWLQRFRGSHPPQIAAMRQDIAAGRLAIELRPTADVDRLLRSPGYWLGRSRLKLQDFWDRRLSERWQRLCERMQRLTTLPVRVARRALRIVARASHSRA